jgi:hypothetical protein
MKSQKSGSNSNRQKHEDHLIEKGNQAFEEARAKAKAKAKTEEGGK